MGLKQENVTANKLYNPIHSIIICIYKRNPEASQQQQPRSRKLIKWIEKLFFKLQNMKPDKIVVENNFGQISKSLQAFIIEAQSEFLLLIYTDSQWEYFL